MGKQILWFIGVCVLGFLLGQCSSGEKIDFLVRNMPHRGAQVGSWKTFLGIAEDDQPPMVRSVVSRIGLGANTNEEAMYFNASHDNEGKQLVANKVYQIIIPANVEVHEFWSLTVYGQDHYLCDNPMNKYAVSSFQNLVKNEDGTIAITLSQKSVGSPENWLPTPPDNQHISVSLRCYNPTVKMLEDIENVLLPIIVNIDI